MLNAGGALERLAQAARLDRRTTLALLGFSERLSPGLEQQSRQLSERLSSGERTVESIQQLRSLAAGSELAGQAPLFYLLVALLQLPAAEARHRSLGVDPAVSKATWSDLSVWAHHLRKREGKPGLTLEALEWAQQALCGHLFRLGALQFELQAFNGPLRAFRHRTSRALSLLSLPTAGFSAAGPWEGHVIDRVTGLVGEARCALSAEPWEQALVPGDPLLRMHIPADSPLSMHQFLLSAGLALSFFARLHPAVKVTGIFGEAWLLDPSVRSFLPDPSGVDALASLCSLYPGAIPEAKTLRRLFGSAATRASIEALPREKLNSLQRACVDFLSPSKNGLCARGAFVLTEELEPRIDEARAVSAR